MMLVWEVWEGRVVVGSTVGGRRGFATGDMIRKLAVLIVRILRVSGAEHDGPFSTRVVNIPVPCVHIITLVHVCMIRNTKWLEALCHYCFF